MSAVDKPIDDLYLQPPAIPTISLKLTDSGNTERFTSLNRGRLHYAPERKLWLLWGGERWRWCLRGEAELMTKYLVRSIYATASLAKDDDARKKIVQWATTSESAAARMNILRLAPHEPGVSLRIHELDRDPWLLNVANGTLDLRTGLLGPHKREDYITKMAPIVYEAGAYSDVWERFLGDVTGGDADLEAYLKRTIGYCLTGLVSEKAFFFLYGVPDGMKSTFIWAIANALGDYAASASFSTWLVQSGTGGNRPDLVDLIGARFVSSVEVRHGARFDEEILKKWTGGDAVTAAAKYENPVTFHPVGKLFMAANDSPIIRDGDAGALARMRRIPFNHPLPAESRDPSMRHKLGTPEVMAAILSWALEGCLEWQKAGKLGSCAVVDVSTREYAEEMDRTKAFFDECCTFAPTASVSTAELRATYVNWCQANGVRFPLDSREFAKKLVSRKCESIKHKKIWTWRGLELGSGDT